MAFSVSSWSACVQPQVYAEFIIICSWLDGRAFEAHAQSVDEIHAEQASTGFHGEERSRTRSVIP